MSARDLVGALVFAAALPLAGCGSTPGEATPPSPMAMIAFVPAAISVDGLTLTTATLRLDHIRAFGDAPPAGPPPGPAPPLVDSLDLDARGTGASVTQEVPQGLYSGVEFMFRDAQLVGTWKNVPFTAHLAMFQGPRVDLHATTTQEAVAGGTIVYTVAVAPTQWFFDAMMQPVLDAATASATGDAGTMTITCDAMSNASVAMTMTTQISGSFTLP
jgi:hypothetical protein